jgi:hypothetical protein
MNLSENLERAVHHPLKATFDGSAPSTLAKLQQDAREAGSESDSCVKVVDIYPFERLDELPSINWPPFTSAFA